MGMRASIYPMHSGMLYRRWEPGQGYRSDPGVTGIGDYYDESGEYVPYDEPVYDTGAVFQTTVTADPYNTGDPLADILKYGEDHPGDFGQPSTGDPLADILAYGQAHPGDIGLPSSTPLLASVAKTLGLTSQQVAAITKGTIAPASTVNKSCPSGFVNTTTGACIPPAAGTGQLVSFATNQQLMTWGAVVFGGLLFIKLAGKR